MQRPWRLAEAKHFPRKKAFPTRFIEVTGKAAAVVNARRRALASVVGRCEWKWAGDDWPPLMFSRASNQCASMELWFG